MFLYLFISIFKTTLSNSNTTTTSDLWQPSFYFPSSFDSKQYHTTETNNHFDYLSSTHPIDPDYQVLRDDYSPYAYTTQTGYNSTSIDSYSYNHPTYVDSSTTLPSYLNYPPVSSQWNLDINKTSNHDSMYMNS